MSLALALALALVATSAARGVDDEREAADETTEAPLSGALGVLSDAELDRRIAFLARRFEAGRRHAALWQYGFTSAWSTGIGVAAVQAGLASDHDDRVAAFVTGGKAIIGTARLLAAPHPARLGAAPLELGETGAGEARATREARLVAGERHLLAIAQRARRRGHWLAHVANVGLNALGGGLILGLGNPSDAISSVGVGVLFGELLIWTEPGRGVGDLEAYRDLVDARRSGGWRDRVTIGLVPAPGALHLQLRF